MSLFAFITTRLELAEEQELIGPLGIAMASSSFSSSCMVDDQRRKKDGKRTRKL